MDKVMEKVNALSLAEKLIAGGGILMLIASVFAWWKYSVSVEGIGGGSFSQDGWGAPGDIWSILAILVSLALAGSVIAFRFGNVARPALPPNWNWGMVYGGGAAAVVVLMLLKAWRILATPVGGFSIGFFIAVVAAAAIAYGGYLLYSQEKAAGSTRA